MITDIQSPKPYMGRPVLIEKHFLVQGTFKSQYAAQGWLKDNGYSYGSLDDRRPVAIVKGKYNFTQKWHNFSDYDKKAVDGVMTGDMRDAKENFNCDGESLGPGNDRALYYPKLIGKRRIYRS
eukprot:gene14871-17420_t